MTYDEAVDIIFDEARMQGEPLTRDFCEHIVRKLFGIVYIPDLKPGDIAQNHRERYTWDADAENHLVEGAARSP
jgi:hypothetical protein